MNFNDDLTDWFYPHIKPARVGEYNASIYHLTSAPNVRRWWDGSKWSDYYFPGERRPIHLANESDQDRIYWRGLLNQNKE